MPSRRLFARLNQKHGGDEARGENRRNRAAAQKQIVHDVISTINTQENRDPTVLFSHFMGTKKVGRAGHHHELPEKKDPSQRENIVVVGAGFSGLSCAYELLASGQYNVVILEARDRVGGRVWTVHQADFKKPIEAVPHPYTTAERGGELIGLNHFFWLTYADKFDLHMDYLEEPDTEDVQSEESKELYEYMKLIIDELDASAAALHLYDKTGADTHALKPWSVHDAEKLDHTSLEQYLDALIPKYKGKTAADLLQEKKFPLPTFDIAKFENALGAVKSDFEHNNGTPCSRQSLLFNLTTIANGNRRICKRLFERLADNIDLSKEKARKLSFWTDAELYRCREGNGALAVKFKENIVKLGGVIQLDSKVTAIRVLGDNVEIDLEHGKFSLPHGAKISKVVCTVAPGVWKEIHFEPAIPHLVHPQMGFLVKYLFNVRPSVTKEFRQLKDTHASWAMAWEAVKNDVADDKAINTLAVFAGGEYAQKLAHPDKNLVPGSDEEEHARRKYVIDNLNARRGSPSQREFTTDDILGSIFMDYPSDPLIGGGYSCPAVGEVTTLGPFVHSPFHQKVFFAGEYACRYKWVGFMEGALISGAGVAKEILKEVRVK